MSDEVILSAARERGAEGELYRTQTETTVVNFLAGKLHQISISQASTAALRTIYKGRLGFAAAAGATDPRRLVDASLAAAPYGRQVNYAFPSPAAAYTPVETYDPRLARLSPSEMVAWGDVAVAMLSAADAAFVPSCSIERTTGTVSLANTSGFNLSYEFTTISAELVIQRAAPNDVLVHYRWDASAAADVDVAGLAGWLLDDLAPRDRVVTPPTGKMDLLFAPAEVPTLLFPVITCLNGAYVADGSSALTGKIGRQIFDPRITLTDDPTLPRAAGSFPFDGEGIGATRRHLIEGGVLRSYLTDLDAASRLGVAPAGNASREPTKPPRAAVSNVSLPPGEKDLNALIRDTRRGILVLATAGGEMANTRAGELGATISYGLYVENGDITGRVKDAIFAGNVFEMLGRRLRDVGSGIERANGSYFVPPVVIADQTVTCK